MKILFIAGPSPPTLFWVPPLASALRNQGHDVVMATTEEMVPVAEKMGIPFVAVTDRTLESLLSTDRAGEPVPEPTSLDEQQRFAGAWFARLAAASIDSLLELADHWRPDLVVGGTSCYAASLLAAHLGIPHVRHAWDFLDNRDADPYADEELVPELTQLGLTQLPPPDLFLDVCPPSIRREPPAHPTQALRWVPGNLQQRLEPWMLARGDRPRVCVTAGSRVAMTDSQDFLSGLAESLRGLDAELLVAAPEEVAPELRERLPGLRIGWMPLEVLAPSCDLIVHHGGAATGMTAMSAGVPQLVLFTWPLFRDSWERVAHQRASINLPDPDDHTPETLGKTCHELLTDGSYRDSARALSAEMAELPGPADQVVALEALVT